MKKKRINIMESKINKVIDRFFHGEYNYTYSEDYQLGHIWISRHGQRISFIKNRTLFTPSIMQFDELRNPIISEMEVLTWEPIKGGQYEIAIRVWNEEEQDWMGYRVSDVTKTYLLGYNTRGH